MGLMKEMYMQEMFNEQEYIQTGFDIDHELKEREYENAKLRTVSIDEVFGNPNDAMGNTRDVACMDMFSEPKESINQINNNKMTKKTMKQKLNGEAYKVETRKEALRRLYTENGLTEEDIYKDKRGFVIITRTGIDKIVSKQNITVAYEVVTMDIEKGYVVLKAVATIKAKDGTVRNMMSFGEAADNNLMGGGKKFPVAMAEKRAMSRVVLKIAGFYEQGVFGQDEIVD